MGRAPCCDKANVKKGPWSPEEDLKLKEYIEKYGTGGNWIALPQKAGLRRCGKSCRLRWLNYLRPNIKHGEFSDDEDRIICTLFASIGSRWSIIAAQLPGRTDNDIKNYWNTKLKKKLMGMVVQMPPSQRNTHQAAATFSSLLHSCSSPLTTSSSSPYYKYNNNNNNNNYYYSQQQVKSFTNLDDQTPPIISSIPSILHQSQPHQESNFVGPPMQNYSTTNYQVVMKKDTSSSTLLTFGGDHHHHQAASCCTSSEDDGSSSNNNNGEQQQMGLVQNYFFYNNGVHEEEDQKFMLSTNYGTSSTGGATTNGLWGNIIETPPSSSSVLDYGLEEINQLITTNICNNFFVDENKSTEEERVMMYY